MTNPGQGEQSGARAALNYLHEQDPATVAQLVEDYGSVVNAGEDLLGTLQRQLPAGFTLGLATENARRNTDTVTDSRQRTTGIAIAPESPIAVSAPVTASEAGLTVDASALDGPIAITEKSTIFDALASDVIVGNATKEAAGRLNMLERQTVPDLVKTVQRLALIPEPRRLPVAQPALPAAAFTERLAITAGDTSEAPTAALPAIADTLTMNVIPGRETQLGTPDHHPLGQLAIESAPTDLAATVSIPVVLGREANVEPAPARRNIITDPTGTHLGSLGLTAAQVRLPGQSS